MNGKHRDSIDAFKENIKTIYSGTRQPIKANIFRGHSRTMSTEVEDNIALFISSFIPENYSIYLDPSIYICGKNNRPDLLIVNEKQEVVAMIEMKANMGFCRNASSVIDSIVKNDDEFKKNKTLCCEFSSKVSFTASYGGEVKLFLISLTDWNCSLKHHVTNKEYAIKNKILYYTLFSGWYGKLIDKDIESFIDFLSMLKEQY